MMEEPFVDTSFHTKKAKKGEGEEKVEGAEEAENSKVLESRCELSACRVV